VSGGRGAGQSVFRRRRSHSKVMARESTGKGRRVGRQEENIPGGDSGFNRIVPKMRENDLDYPPPADRAQGGRTDPSHAHSRPSAKE